MKQCYMRFPGGKKKAFTISYDDNITQDERLIKKMEQYHIKGTFNIIPGWFSKEDAVFPEGETYINVTEKKAKICMIIHLLKWQIMDMTIKNPQRFHQYS